MSWTYIASPYTSEDKEVVLQRYIEAKRFTGKMLRNREHVYSPIVHCHEIAQDEELPTDFEFWGGYNRAMLSTASKMIVLMLNGWENSVGVQGEIEFAKLCGIPIEYVNYNEYIYA
jgi:hypothetical protein